MASEVLAEEFEVLESIYPTELTKLSEKEISIEVESEETVEGYDPVKLVLHVVYPDDYPDELPQLSLDILEGELEDEEMERLITEMKTAGEESLGMAMTFTLVSNLREQLAILEKEKVEQRKTDEMEKERLAIEAEEARTRGTPVTPESFEAWRVNFMKEVSTIRAREEDQRLKGMTPKEREEYKRLATRLTGRQLFERNRDLDVGDEISLMEEGTVSVDISQYEREVVEEEEEEAQVTFSDSDSDTE